MAPRGRGTARKERARRAAARRGTGRAELPQRPRVLTLGCFLAWLTITRNIAAEGDGLPPYPAPETVLPLLRPSPNVTGGPRRGRCPLPGCSSSGGCLFACRSAQPGRRPAAAPALRSPLVPCFHTAPDRQASKQRPAGRAGTSRGTPRSPKLRGAEQAPTRPRPASLPERCEQRLRRGREGMAGGAAEGPWGPPWA